MGIYRLPDGIVMRFRNDSPPPGQRLRQIKSAQNAVACAVLSAELHVFRNPLRTADTTAAGGSTWRDRAVRALPLVLLTIAPISFLGAARNPQLPQLSGYKAVPVHYAPLNKMIMSVQINGQPAYLLVDTGSNEIILDPEAAESFGIRPSQRGLRYIGFTEMGGRMLPVGFVRSITAGSMRFGSSPVVLRNLSRSDTGKAHVDGVVGLQTLFRHKAVINCRTKFVFFKGDQAHRTNFVAAALSAKFTRVPLRR